MLINQGVHENTEIRKEPIVEANVTARIMDVKEDELKKGQLLLTLRLLTGKNVNKTLIDKINVLPKQNLTWKYLSLRRALNDPYKEGEDERIDPELLFMFKDVVVNLGTYKYYDRNENPHFAQKIMYLENAIPQTEQRPQEKVDEDCGPF